MKTLYNLFASLMIVYTIVLTAATIYYVYLEKPALEYLNVPFPGPVSIKSGERLPVNVSACNRTNKTITYTLARTIVRVDVYEPYALPDITVHLKPGCVTATSLATLLPEKINKGLYKVVGISIVEGRIRTFHVLWETTTFEVI